MAQGDDQKSYFNIVNSCLYEKVITSSSLVDYVSLVTAVEYSIVDFLAILTKAHRKNHIFKLT